jgi:dienelactone hydrolase
VAQAWQQDVGSDEASIEPSLDLPEATATPRAVVLVLPGGKAKSHGRVEPGQLAVRRMQPFARAIEQSDDSLAVARLRYRFRGWNDPDADPLVDVDFALDRLESFYGGLPVVLVGHSLGGRAALHAAGHPTVKGVVALAPWLPGTEPVAQLAGRDLAILHGTRDATTSPGASARYAARAVDIALRVACLRVPRSGHGMLLRARLWNTLTTEFVRAIVDDESFDRPMADATAAGCLDCHPGAPR